MKRAWILWILHFCSNSSVLALPHAPTLFCDTFPDSPSCSGTALGCDYCHKSVPPDLNIYGSQLSKSLKDDGISFPQTMDDFKAWIEGNDDRDTDGDGALNKDERSAGTRPGDASSGGDATPVPLADDYDPIVAYRRIWWGVCGEPAPFKEFQTFRELDRDKQRKELHVILDECLDSVHWLGKDGVVWQIGHYKIRPVGSVKFGEDEGILPIVDYYQDYQLFVYSQSDDNDAREQLRADYTVDRIEDSTSVEYVKRAPSRLLDGQVMQPEYRVGLLTSFWNLSFYLNYTTVARVLVAQAFNAYLGISLANMQGLNESPVKDTQFADYDGKGVTQPECAVCHRTIDPLTYPFRNYNGLSGTLQVLAGQNANGLADVSRLGDKDSLTPLSYALPRMDYLNQTYPGINKMPEVGYIFGKRVENLHEWAEALMEHDAFAANTVRDYWKALLGREPRANEQTEFKALWTALKETHDFRVEAMLHEFIETVAFGSNRLAD